MITFHMETLKEHTLSESTNINTKWLENIYENLKKIEEFERLAREGCTSILDYLQIPFDKRKIIIADVQYKNLRLMFNEFKLVLPDLTPVIDKDDLKIIQADIELFNKQIYNKELFVDESYSELSHTIKSSMVTPYFYFVLDKLSNLRKELIYMIKHILYIEDNGGNTKPKW